MKEQVIKAKKWFAHTFPGYCLTLPTPDVSGVEFSDEELKLADFCIQLIGNQKNQHTREQMALRLRVWEPIGDHLSNVAILSQKFANKFNSGYYGFASGAWHDLGKSKEEFLRRCLRSSMGMVADRVDHMSAGAIHAITEASLNHYDKKVRACLRYVALVIKCHHGGLHNFNEINQELHKNPSPREIECLNSDVDWNDVPVMETELPPDFLFNPKNKEIINYQHANWVRFLYSCLIDADRLSTEAFTQPNNQEIRQSKSETNDWEQISSLLEEKLRQLQDATSQSETIRSARGSVSNSSAIAGSCWDRGNYMLTAPTGTGKTLAALRFALNHRAKHNLKRIIVVIPYCAVIDQTCRDYQSFMGDDVYFRNVLEHHSDFDLTKLDNLDDFTRSSYELACDNFDYPIVVTTAVQFYETLYGSRASRLRKLHNFTNSMIIIDEPQANPFNLRDYFEIAEKELVENYGCTVVRATATQPGSASFKEIVDPPIPHIKRCAVILPEELDVEDSVDSLLQRSVSHDRSMTVVPSRKAAQEMFQRVRNIANVDDIFHLSTTMCPAHREHVYNAIKDRLSHRKTCHLFSTMMVATGANLDFLYVQHFLHGIAELLQACGRTGRHGIHEGLMEIYISPWDLKYHPEANLRKSCSISAIKDQMSSKTFDLFDPELLRNYYHYLQLHVNGKKIVFSNHLDFEEVSSKFRLILENTVKIVVPYLPEIDYIEDLIDRYNNNPNRYILRKLQPYTIDVYESDYKKIIHHVSNHGDDSNMIKYISPYSKVYNHNVGLIL